MSCVNLNQPPDTNLVQPSFVLFWLISGINTVVACFILGFILCYRLIAINNKYPHLRASLSLIIALSIVVFFSAAVAGFKLGVEAMWQVNYSSFSLCSGTFALEAIGYCLAAGAFCLLAYAWERLLSQPHLKAYKYGLIIINIAFDVVVFALSLMVPTLGRTVDIVSNVYLGVIAITIAGFYTIRTIYVLAKSQPWNQLESSLASANTPLAKQIQEIIKAYGNTTLPAEVLGLIQFHKSQMKTATSQLLFLAASLVLIVILTLISAILPTPAGKLVVAIITELLIAALRVVLAAIAYLRLNAMEHYAIQLVKLKSSCKEQVPVETMATNPSQQQLLNSPEEARV